MFVSKIPLMSRNERFVQNLLEAGPEIAIFRTIRMNLEVASKNDGFFPGDYPDAAPMRVLGLCRVTKYFHYYQLEALRDIRLRTSLDSYVIRAHQNNDMPEPQRSIYVEAGGRVIAALDPHDTYDRSNPMMHLLFRSEGTAYD